MSTPCPQQWEMKWSCGAARQVALRSQLERSPCDGFLRFCRYTNHEPCPQKTGKGYVDVVFFAIPQAVEVIKHYQMGKVVMMWLPGVVAPGSTRLGTEKEGRARGLEGWQHYIEGTHNWGDEFKLQEIVETLRHCLVQADHGAKRYRQTRCCRLPLFKELKVICEQRVGFLYLAGD